MNEFFEEGLAPQQCSMDREAAPVHSTGPRRGKELVVLGEDGTSAMLRSLARLDPPRDTPASAASGVRRGHSCGRKRVQAELEARLGVNVRGTTSPVTYRASVMLVAPHLAVANGASTYWERWLYARALAVRAGRRHMHQDASLVLHRILEQDLDVPASLIHIPVVQLSVKHAILLHVATALALAPDVLLIDNITASLDDGAAQRVRRAVQLHAERPGDNLSVVWASNSSAELRRLGLQSDFILHEARHEAMQRPPDHPHRLNQRDAAKKREPQSYEWFSSAAGRGRFEWLMGLAVTHAFLCQILLVSAAHVPASFGSSPVSSSSPISALWATAGEMFAFSTPSRAAVVDPTHPVNISFPSVLIAAGLLFITSILTYVLHLKLILTVIFAAVRCTVQLCLVGFVLIYIIRINTPLLTIGYCCMMIAAAGAETVQRLQYSYKMLPLHILGCQLLASCVSIVFALFIVTGVGIDAQYMIPMYGMLLGNSLTGMTVSLNTLLAEFAEHKANIEAFTCLGATRFEATRGIVARAVTMGLTPSLNQMSVAGLVAIPGMMTGQILGGTAPEQAAFYQIMIMFLIGSTSIVSVSLVNIVAVTVLINADHIILDEKITRTEKGPSWIEKAGHAVTRIFRGEGEAAPIPTSET
ncbi:UPF0014 membrane protein [Porphyridium purpureum]|uniref:UPF0014 membrane protein n=1 Tax=Porphyridium purpureum TaxID=35688 RepID=A0A5J4Z919_PORPP|nr:UPF0014 membrane protein [Porphyridium purpureum]|eukprot:POR9008..scf295_1